MIATNTQYRNWFRHLRVLWRPDTASPTSGREISQPQTLASQIADRVCSRYNKDFKMLLVGPMGSGKSRSLLYLAVETAKEIAARVDGSPTHWPSYFSLDNVVIGDPAGHEALFRSLQKYNVYILDDAGVALDARNFSSAYNKTLNHIFQTCRTDNAVLLVSAPVSFLFDKVPRTLVSTYGEIAEARHPDGFNLVKVFQLDRNFHQGKTLFVYPTHGKDTTIRRYIFANPRSVPQPSRPRSPSEPSSQSSPSYGSANKRRVSPDMRAYSIALALFTFGFVVGALNTLAIADTHLVAPSSAFGPAQVAEIVNGSLSAPVSYLHDALSVVSLLGALLDGLKTALCILPLLASYGIPAPIALIIQGPIWLVYAVSIISFVANRHIG